MMRARLIALYLLSFVPAAAVNFAFVQKTPSGGASAQAFPGNTTAGNCVVAIVYGTASGATVSDTGGNTYTLLATVGGFPVRMDIFAALHISGGADTVTATAGGIAAMEYSSVSTSYFANPGSALGPSAATPNLTNTGTGFNSPTEVMVVWGATCNCGGGATWTITTGTVRYTSTMPFNFGQTVTGGDDNVANMSGTYNNTVKINGVTAGSQTVISVFLNLGTGGGTTVFPVIY